VLDSLELEPHISEGKYLRQYKSFERKFAQKRDSFLQAAMVMGQ
jgi:hypothetical protein